MTYYPPNTTRTHALHSLLQHNEFDCIRRNIRIRVDEINSVRTVALCSVQQRLHGPFRRTCSQQELIFRGEQALHPLQELGFVPMITVRVPTLAPFPLPTAPLSLRSLMDWVKDVWRWGGSPFSREGFGSAPVHGDPFGWKQAMRAPDGPVKNDHERP